jgi:hypothetical protein
MFRFEEDECMQTFVSFAQIYIDVETDFLNMHADLKIELMLMLRLCLNIHADFQILILSFRFAIKHERMKKESF